MTPARSRWRSVGSGRSKARNSRPRRNQAAPEADAKPRRPAQTRAKDAEPFDGETPDDERPQPNERPLHGKVDGFRRESPVLGAGIEPLNHGCDSPRIGSIRL